MCVFVIGSKKYDSFETLRDILIQAMNSMCLVNKRLYSDSLVYSRLSLDFNSIAKKKKHFDLLMGVPE